MQSAPSHILYKMVEINSGLTIISFNIFLSKFSLIYFPYQGQRFA